MIRTLSSRTQKVPIVLVALLLASQTALAEEESHVLPCRPTVACTANIEAAGTVTVEAGYLGSRLEHDLTAQSVPYLVKWSISEWLQGQLGSNGPTLVQGPAPARYHDNLTVGAKARLLAGDSTALSVSAAVSAPLPAQEGYLRAWDAFFTGYLSHYLPLGVSADLNLGLDLWRIGDGAALAQPWGALALGHELPAGFSAMAEPHVFLDASPVAPADSGVLLALSRGFGSSLVVDGGVNFGIASDREVSVFVGLTFSPVHR
jgi:hypothetical protein